MRKRGATAMLDRGTRAEELLDAAVTVIRRDGPGASMERIALEGGVTKPVLYRHVGDKAGIYEAVAARYMSELRDDLVNAMRPGAPPRETLGRTIDVYLANIEREPQIYRFLTQEARLAASGAGAPVETFIRQIAGEVTIAITAGLRGAGSDLGAAEPIGFGITGMVQLAGDWWLDRRTMPRSKMAGYLTDLVWEGISAVVAQPGPRRD